MADERICNKRKISTAQENDTLHKKMLQKVEFLPSAALKQLSLSPQVRFLRFQDQNQRQSNP